ncbi:MAG: protein translocase component YidC [Chloroflexia bacterium]|nr:protein translocase component YidC [Chloroflexia bacterium]
MAIWTFLISSLEYVLLTFYAWTGNPGVAIILFTLLARLVLLPLTIRQLQSSRKIQALQPALSELQRKYGKDAQQLQKETMKLYADNKANPVSGCLPVFIQLPLFLGIYQAVFQLTSVAPGEHAIAHMIEALNHVNLATNLSAVKLDQPQLSGGFLWLTDLGRTDPLHILPVLSVIFQLIVQLMSTPRVQDPQQKAMQQTMLFMPILFGYIGFTFPSGAVLYWVVGSILSMIQQYIFSGWGSLANYLTFLPTRSGLFPPPAVVGAGTQEAAKHIAEVDAAPKLDFWDVVRPLTDDDKSKERTS